MSHTNNICLLLDYCGFCIQFMLGSMCENNSRYSTRNELGKSGWTVSHGCSNWECAWVCFLCVIAAVDYHWCGCSIDSSWFNRAVEVGVPCGCVNSTHTINDAYTLWKWYNKKSNEHVQKRRFCDNIQTQPVSQYPSVSSIKTRVLAASNLPFNYHGPCVISTLHTVIHGAMLWHDIIIIRPSWKFICSGLSFIGFYTVRKIISFRWYDNNCSKRIKNDSSTLSTKSMFNACIRSDFYVVFIDSDNLLTRHYFSYSTYWIVIDVPFWF